MSAKDLTDMTLDKFKMWKVGALKDYLPKKAIKVTGNKEDLAARCFIAWENKVPDKKNSRGSKIYFG